MSKSKPIALVCITLVFMSVSFVYADIYKCKGEDGVVVFSDRPCGKDAKIAFKGRSDTAGLNDLLAGFKTVVRTDETPYNYDPAFERFEAHTRLVGSYLFKNSEFLGIKERDRKGLIKTMVTSYWGPRSVKGVYQYTLIVGYKQEIRPDGNYVFRTGFVTIRKKGKSFDHPGMSDITYLQRRGTGWWK